MPDMRDESSRRRLVRILVLSLSLSLSLVLGEIGLRALRPEPFRVWIPGNKVDLHPAPDVLPGVRGASRFEINREGMRAGEPPSGEAHRILTVGGSTTECLFLDQDETWPHLLEARLRASGRPTFVGNVGKSGHSSRLHALHVTHLLPQHPDYQSVVVLVGVNDVMIALQGDAPRRGPFEAADYLKGFVIVPREAIVPKEAPWYVKSRLYGLFFTTQAPVSGAAADLVQDTGGRFYTGLREKRRAGPKRAELPPLDDALRVFRSNLETMADATKGRGVRLILMTQPVLWRADLPPDLDALLWFGWGPRGGFYYTAGALAEAMRRYNEVTLDVCRARGVECVDLAASMPKDTTSFYDDCHFNEGGAAKVADIVAAHFLARAPYKP